MRTLLVIVVVALAAAGAQDNVPGGSDNPHHHTQPDPPIVPAGRNQTLQDSMAGGVLAGLLLGQNSAGKENDPGLLSDRGPRFPALFSMSAFAVRGFVKGGWPMALDYELREPGIYLLTVTAEGVAPFVYVLDGNHPGRHTAVIALPARFGDRPRAATCTIRAMSGAPGEARPLFFRVFGWACGKRAVGSIAIDQVTFTPPVVLPRDKQQAFYGFHSHADFEKVTAEFERVGLINGSIVAQLEDKQDLDEVVRHDTRISNKTWNLKRATPGQHLLQVRAWYSVNHGGDWVIAWSPQIVRIGQ